MLKGLDPALNAEVLYALRAMGHGDTIVICDTNFPADAVGRETTFGRAMYMPDCSAPQATRAILSIMPLDTFIDYPALGMQVVDSPDDVLTIHQEVQDEINQSSHSGTPGKPGVSDKFDECDVSLGYLERMAFYESARGAYGVIATGERRFYGNFIFSKGVIGPAGP